MPGAQEDQPSGVEGIQGDDTLPTTPQDFRSVHVFGDAEEEQSDPGSNEEQDGS